VTRGSVVTPVISWPFSYRLMGDNSGIAREFSALLYSCGFLPSSDSARITIEVSPATSTIVPPCQCEPIFNWRGLSIRREAERIWFSYRAWELQLDMTTLTLKCWGPDPEATEGLNFREFFLLSPLLFLMHRLGYFEMHAAACVLEEHGYLFVGPSGSGKTSAVLSLIALGAKYLSDDAVVISRVREGGLAVRGLRRSFSLKSDYLRHHPELAGYANELVPGTEKRRIDPRQIWPGQYVSVAQPQFIVACKLVDQETSEIVPISKAEALARLVGSTPWIAFDQSSAPDQLGVFRALSESCRTFELKAARDVFRNGNRLASLLAPTRLA
jgi:hypothetical protein